MPAIARSGPRSSRLAPWWLQRTAPVVPDPAEVAPVPASPPEVVPAAVPFGVVPVGQGGPVEFERVVPYASGNLQVADGL